MSPYIMAFLATLGASALKFLLTLVSSWATTEFVEWVFFWSGGQIVKRTDTPHDDEWLAEIHKLYDAKKNGTPPAI